MKLTLSSFLRFVLLSLWALLGSGCASTPKLALSKEALDTALTQARGEWAFGRELAARLVGRFGLIADPAASEYVALVGRSLSAVVGRPELAMTFGVLDTEQVTSFGVPGGYVFLSKGLLRQLRSEAELAAILAHEIAHVNLGHLYARVEPRRATGTGGDEAIGILVSSGLGLADEKAADEAAAVYVSLLGYDPTALHGLLHRLHDAHERVSLSTAFPPFRERLRHLMHFCRRNGLKAREPAGAPVTDARFHAALARWL